jgi:integrase
MSKGSDDLKALRRQLAEMAVTLGSLTEPAEGGAPLPSAGEVTLYEYWSTHLDGLKEAKLNAQYRTAICHLQNRVRKCDECGLVILPLKRLRKRAPVKLIGGRRCVICSGSISNTPVAREFTVNVLSAWVSQLVTDGYSPETAGRILVQIRGVLNAMADAGEDIKPPRRMPRIQRGRKRIRLVADEDILAVYQSAENAKRWSPTFWRTLICGMTLYGFRPSEITSIMWKGPKREDIREGIYWGQKPPHDELRQANVTHPHGWTVYLPGKQRRIKPDPLILPNSKVWAEHLKAAKTLRNGSGQVLPIGTEPGDYTTAEDDFRAEFARLKKLAGVSRHWTFKDLRRNVESRFARQFTSADAMALTGHAQRSVSGQSYLDLVLRLIDEVDQFELTELFKEKS